MLAPLLYALFTIGTIMTIFYPGFGVCFLVAAFLTYPDAYAPLLANYRANLILAALIFINTTLRRIDRDKFNFIITAGAFVALAILSSLLSQYENRETLLYIYQYLKIFTLLFIILTYFNDIRGLLLLINTCIICCMSASIIAIYQVFFLKMDRGFGFGKDMDPNVFASFIVSLIPVTYYFFSTAKNKLFRQFYLISFIIMIGGVFTTVSRAALLAVLYIISAIFIKNIKKISTIFIAFILIYFFTNYALDWFKQRQTISTSVSGKTSLDTSSSSRLMFWTNAIKLWARHPVFGVGMDNYAQACRSELNIKGQRHGVHNTWLQVLAENGSIAFIFLIKIMMLCFKDLARLAKNEDSMFNEFANYLKVGLIALLICASFIGFISYYFLWIYLSLPVLLDKISQKTPVQLDRR
jgi:O-antigen ligase